MTDKDYFEMLAALNAAENADDDLDFDFEEVDGCCYGADSDCDCDWEIVTRTYQVNEPGRLVECCPLVDHKEAIILGLIK